MAYAAEGLAVIDNGVAHWNARRRRLREALVNIESLGESFDETITITSTGLMDFEVSISASGLDRLDEQGFLEQLHAAIGWLQGHHQRRVNALKKQYMASVSVANARPRSTT